MSIVNKVTNKAGSSIFSLGLGGGTVKKTRKAKAKRASGSKSPGKSLRSTADGLKVKKYSLKKGKRVSKKIVKKTKRIKKSAGDVIAAECTQVAVKEENGASQARQIMQLKQQLADAKDVIAAERTQVAAKEENGASQAREMMLLADLSEADNRLKRSQANETLLVDRVAELEIENAELLKIQQSGKSDSGQALTDANECVSELEKQLADALAANHESAELRADDQQRIAELEQQLADDQQRNSELKKQLADALEKIERCKKALVKQQKIIKKNDKKNDRRRTKSTSLKALQSRLEAECPSPPKPGERKMRPRSGYRLPEGANLAKQQTEKITRSRASQKAIEQLKQRNSKIEQSREQKCNDSKLLGVTKNFLREKRRGSIAHSREQKCNSNNKLLGVTKNFFHEREREYTFTDFL